MPTIAFVNTKGGAGKTTSCVVIGTELARFARVLMIDTDKKARLIKWSRSSGENLENITIKACLDKRGLVSLVREAGEQYDYILIDTEGRESELNAFAVNESDLVIIPLKDRQMEADDTIETIEEIETISKSYRRRIPYRILFTGTKSASHSRLEKHINASMRAAYPAFTAELKTRTAFDAIFNSGTSLAGLDKDISGVEEASQDAISLIEELIATLEEESANAN